MPTVVTRPLDVIYDAGKPQDTILNKVQKTTPGVATPITTKTSKHDLFGIGDQPHGLEQEISKTTPSVATPIFATHPRVASHNAGVQRTPSDITLGKRRQASRRL